jgi:hypothetical protein
MTVMFPSCNIQNVILTHGLVGFGFGGVACNATSLGGLPAWTAQSEHQEVWAGPSWPSIALRYDVAFCSMHPFSILTRLI